MAKWKKKGDFDQFFDVFNYKQKSNQNSVKYINNIQNTKTISEIFFVTNLEEKNENILLSIFVFTDDQNLITHAIENYDANLFTILNEQDRICLSFDQNDIDKLYKFLEMLAEYEPAIDQSMLNEIVAGLGLKEHSKLGQKRVFDLISVNPKEAIEKAKKLESDYPNIIFNLAEEFTRIAIQEERDILDAQEILELYQSIPNNNPNYSKAQLAIANLLNTQKPENEEEKRALTEQKFTSQLEARFLSSSKAVSQEDIRFSGLLLSELCGNKDLSCIDMISIAEAFLVLASKVKTLTEENKQLKTQIEQGSESSTKWQDLALQGNKKAGKER